MKLKDYRVVKETVMEIMEFDNILSLRASQLLSISCDNYEPKLSEKRAIKNYKTFPRHW
jgi:hypothetical protein